MLLHERVDGAGRRLVDTDLERAPAASLETLMRNTIGSPLAVDERLRRALVLLLLHRGSASTSSSSSSSSPFFFFFFFGLGVGFFFSFALVHPVRVVVREHLGCRRVAARGRVGANVRDRGWRNPGESASNGGGGGGGAAAARGRRASTSSAATRRPAASRDAAAASSGVAAAPKRHAHAAPASRSATRRARAPWRARAFPRARVERVEIAGTPRPRAPRRGRGARRTSSRARPRPRRRARATR